jgi:hypothetical protein
LNWKKYIKNLKHYHLDLYSNGSVYQFLYLVSNCLDLCYIVFMANLYTNLCYFIYFVINLYFICNLFLLCSIFLMWFICINLHGFMRLWLIIMTRFFLRVTISWKKQKNVFFLLQGDNKLKDQEKWMNWGVFIEGP